MTMRPSAITSWLGDAALISFHTDRRGPTGPAVPDAVGDHRQQRRVGVQVLRGLSARSACLYWPRR
jgi:hypothetical protein